MGLYSEGSSFHRFRREAITEANESDPYQAMRAAGHSKFDTNLLFGLTDEKRQEEAIEFKSVIFVRLDY
ncbi:MAG TPA: hypothetical protein VMS37_06905 [Verrucomicrobiae bacterium]|nr:hypothetical protein [Verrucomicrobiae bacterium]